MTNEDFIKLAIEESKQAVRDGNYPYGAVLVVNGAVILSGRNTVVTSGDIAQHAELGLLREACRNFDRGTLSQATLYASCEPCAMCAGGIYWSGVGRLVYSCSAEKDAEISKMPFAIPCRVILQRRVGRSVEVVGPLLESESCRVLEEFWPQKLAHDPLSFGLNS